jgi:hypothetical protein
MLNLLIQHVEPYLKKKILNQLIQSVGLVGSKCRTRLVGSKYRTRFEEMLNYFIQNVFFDIQMFN